MLRLCVFAFLVITHSSLVFAQTTSTWNNTTGDWSDATRWDTNPLFPNNGNGGNDYNAVISAGTVTLDEDIEIEALTLGGATIDGDFDLTLNGLFSWTQGSFSGTGTTTIASGATLSMNSSGPKQLARTLVNDGTATWTDNTHWQFTGGTFQNNSDFTAVVNSGQNDINGLSGTINNAGTFTKQGAGSVIVQSTGVAFNNSGSVDVQQGTLALRSGTHTGDFTGATGATLQFSGNNTFAASSDISGGMNVNYNFSGTHDGITNTTGAVTFGPSANATINGPLATSVLNVNGTAVINGSITAAGNPSSTPIINLEGTLNGSADFDIDSSLNWASGTLSGSGETTITSTGTLTLSSTGGDNFLGRELVNDGSIEWTTYASGAGHDLIFSNAILTNNASFTAHAWGNANTTFDVMGGLAGSTNVFNNTGTFIKTGGGRTVFRTNLGAGNSGVVFNNSGAVDVQEGTLQLLAGGNQTGSFALASGTTLTIAGNHSFATSSSLNGAGDLTFQSGTHNFAGTIDIAGTVNIGSGGSFELNGGLLKASALTFNGGASFNGGRVAVETIHGNLGVVGATVSPGGKGSIGTTNVVYGSVQPDYGPSSTSTLEIEIAGLDSFDNLNVEGTAYLNGTLDLSYLPSLGELNNQTFRILTASSIVGTFNTLQGSLFDDGTVTPIYGADYVDLLVSFDPPPAPTPILNEVRKVTASD